MSAGLEILGLAKAFGGRVVLRDVGLSVPAGSLIAILGASGSGKSTLLRLIAGFEVPDAGDVQLNGESLCAVAPERRGIGYVAQEGALFPHLCVADNITFGLTRAQRRARDRVAELLAMVDLPGAYADRAPQELSGGEQQRVALARALAPRPRLVLLDEPFSALDAGLRAETRQAAAAAVAATGAAAILVTHDQEEALSMGAQVGVLQGGRLAQVSAPAELYHRPATPALAGFVGEAVFLPGVVKAGRVDCALGVLAVADRNMAGAVRVMLRPEQIEMFHEAGPGRVAATVGDVRFFGHDALVRFAVPGAGSGADVFARLFSQNLPREGQDIWLQVAGEVVAFAAKS
jgi:iron(III) transport system ATP-binding protein